MTFLKHSDGNSIFPKCIISQYLSPSKGNYWWFFVSITKLYPSRTINVSKTFKKSKKVQVNVSKAPFQKDKLTFLRQLSSMSYQKNREIPPARPRGVARMRGPWDKKNKILIKMPLHPLIIVDLRSKWGSIHQDEKLYEKIKFADDRIACVLWQSTGSDPLLGSGPRSMSA